MRDGNVDANGRGLQVERLKDEVDVVARCCRRGGGAAVVRHHAHFAASRFPDDLYKRVVA